MSKLIKMSVVAGVAAALSLSAYASDLGGNNTTPLDTVNSAVSVEAENSGLIDDAQASPQDVFGSKPGGMQLASSCEGTLPRYSMVAMVHDPQNVPAALAAAHSQCASCSASVTNAGTYYMVYCN